MRTHTTTMFSAAPCLVALAILGFFFHNTASAQRQQRFKAGIIAGVTASQIDGDASAGYHKVGLQGGLRGIVVLKPRQEASVEILFSQRGSRNQPDYPPTFSTTLNFIEVPLQWHYRDWANNGDLENPDFFRIYFNVGLSYSRLLSYADDPNSSIAGITPALPDLNKDSFCFLVGASFFASKHIGFTFRYHRAFNALYSPGKPGTNFANSLNEHYLAFQTMYVF
ncbi:MAG: outer membrane beta-barrel protein [Saprospiraceae bacterium]